MPAGDSSSSAPLPGSTYRLVVSSAEEAVRLIHEKLGVDARVVSVKQIGGKGFASLLRAPQLEVIAEVPATPSNPVLAAASPQAQPPQPAPAASAPVFQIPAANHSEEELSWLRESSPVAPVASSPSAPKPPVSPASSVPPAPTLRPPGATGKGNEALERLLARAGLSEQILTRLRRTVKWPALKELPLGEALKEVVEMLREQWNETPERPLGARVAFFGPPGSGSTTALCKALTIDVFFHQQPAVVMKLDGEQPNPTEGLAMFCEALRVPLIRAADDLEHIPENHRFYFDATGSPLHDGPAWRDMGRLLGEFYIDTRVLVLNAAYDLDLLKRAYALGSQAGATHVVFTHLDEVHHWGKLWDLLLGGGLQPLFFSCGQNVSGELREDTFDQMAQRILGNSGS